MDKTGRGVSRLYVDFVLPHCTKTLCRGTLLCFRKFTEPENFKNKRGRGAYHEFPSVFFLAQNTEIFRRGPLLCFRLLLLANFFMDKRGELSRFIVEYVLSHSTKTLHRGAHLFLREILVREDFMAKRVEVYRFSVEFSLSDSTETFRRESNLCFRKHLVSKNFVNKKRKEEFFCQNCFVSQYRNNSQRSIFVIQKIFVIERFFGQEREGGGGLENQDFLSEVVLPHSTESLRSATVLCFRNILLWKDFMDKRWVSRFQV